MPYLYTRNCPICQKIGVKNISQHLRFAHKLSSEDRKPYLNFAQYQVRNGENVQTNVKKRKTTDSNFQPEKQRYHALNNSKPVNEIPLKNPVNINMVECNEAVKEKPSKSSSNSNADICNETVKGNPTKTVMEKNMKIDNTWTAHSYTGFKFKHPFSMLVVGPPSNRQ